jgi:hypothetical protein
MEHFYFSFEELRSNITWRCMNMKGKCPWTNRGTCSWGVSYWDTLPPGVRIWRAPGAVPQWKQTGTSYSVQNTFLIKDCFFINKELVNIII